MSNITGVVLAAGKGVRMRSRLSKVLHPVAGMPMVSHVIGAAQAAGAHKLVLVVGHGRQEVMAALKGQAISFVVQEQQLGTGHALLQAKPEVGAEDLVLVLAGDTPLLQAGSLRTLIEFHQANRASATVLTAQLPDPYGYGRIIRDAEGSLVKIVEEKDATPEERLVQEINSGMYCFDYEVFSALENLTPENAQGEYYLTDALTALKKMGRRVLAVQAAQEDDIYGINDRVQLAFAEKKMQRRKCRELMLSGVTVIDPETTYVHSQVIIGQDTVLAPFTMLEGCTEVGEGCLIGPGSKIVDSRIGDHTRIDSSRVLQSVIGDDCDIGPYAYIRPGVIVHDGVKIGDFVEVKKSEIGSGSKIPHLSYVGDAVLGEKVNVGAGTITCNYDGVNKYPTFIEDGAFIGSNSNLVAPVRIGAGAVIGAGSTITRDVPSMALGVERASQKVVADWKRQKKDQE